MALGLEALAVAAVDRRRIDPCLWAAAAAVAVGEQEKEGKVDRKEVCDGIN